MRNKKRLLSIIFLLLILGSLPLIIIFTKKRTQLKSGAYFYGAYDVFCEESASAPVSVSEYTENYNEATGEYTLQWTVKNNTQETLKLHTERYSCRCSDPNALATPAELQGVDSAFTGRICVGNWPTTTTSNPPTAAEVNKPWNYCEYEYEADLSKIADDTATQTEKQTRAQATSGIAGGPLVLGPGEEKFMERKVKTNGAKVNHCGSFQLTWNIAEIERSSGQACTIRRLPNQILSTIGILITGDGKVGGEDYGIWRPENVSTVGGTCEANDQVPFCKDECGNGVCQKVVCMAQGCPCPEDEDSCPQDCPRGNPGDGEKICTGNNRCEFQTFEQIRQKVANKELVISCSDGSICNVKEICSNNACVLERGAVGPNDKICSTNNNYQDPNDPTKKKNDTCIKYYNTCEGGQCVRKEGDKQSNCDPKDALACKALCYDKTCRNVEDLRKQNVPTTGLIGCAYTAIGTQPAECKKLTCDTTTKTCTKEVAVENPAKACLNDPECQGGTPPPPPPPPPPPGTDTYDACRDNTCVKIVGKPPTGEKLCNLNDPDPNARCRPVVPPPVTGVDGMALALTVVVAILGLIGIRLVM